MSKTTKYLLSASIACIIVGLAFVTGLVNAESMVGLYVALPLGAVFFGLFLISRVLEKEVSLYDDEQRANQALAKTTTPGIEKKAIATVVLPQGRERSSVAH